MSDRFNRSYMGRTIIVIAMLFIFILSGCDSGSHSAKAAGSGEKPGKELDNTVYIEGVVQGLKGIVILASGKDQQSISKNGLFKFVSPQKVGDDYDVHISSLPNGQVCELSNSKGRVKQGIPPVIVDCADILEVDITVKVPEGYALSDLRLRSNFQEQPLTNGTKLKNSMVKVPIFTFNNTVVSLVNNDDKVLYATYILNPEADTVQDDKSEGSIVISTMMDASSTALSLLMLEPSVVLAIRDRAGKNSATGEVLTPSALFKLFLTTLQHLDSLQQLSSSITTLVNTGGSLSDLGEKIPAQFSLLHETALEEIISAFPLGSYFDYSVPISSKSTANKVVLGSGEGSDVSFSFSPIIADMPVSVTVKNNENRFVSVKPQGDIEQVTLAPGESFDFLIPNGIASQQSFNFDVYGPGLKGGANESNALAIADVAVTSTIEQYFFPSVSLLLGLKKPLQFDISECMTSESISKLRNTLINEGTNLEFIKKNLYHRVYSEFNNLVSSEFVRESSTVSSIKELLGCKKFGVGVLVEKNKLLAYENISSMISLTAPLYLNASMVHEESELFAKSSLSYLARAVQNTRAHRRWQISNVLGLLLTSRNSDQPYFEGESIYFDGSCFNPIDKSAVACDITWSFDDDNIQSGSSVSNVFTLPGEYTVHAKAVNTAGARIENTLQIKVVVKAPVMSVTDTYGRVLIENQLAYDFGVVKVGEVSRVAFSVVNKGSADLVINNILSTNLSFSINSDYAPVLKTLAEGEGKNATEVNFSFSSPVSGVQEGEVNIVSNDPLHPAFKFGLKADAVVIPGPFSGEEASGGVWVLYDGEKSKTFTFTAQRVSATYETDEKRMNIRAFSELENDFPQIDLKLLGYELEGSTRSEKTYLLDDKNNDLCLGFVALSENDEANQFCTTSSNGNRNFSGRVTIMASSKNEKTKRALFHFKAVSREFCSVDEASCKSVEITGELYFND